MKFEDLPFVNITEYVRSTWNVSPTGNYSEDYKTGAEFFAALKRVVQDTGNVMLYSHVLFGIVEGGKTTGVEIGFINTMTASLA